MFFCNMSHRLKIAQVSPGAALRWVTFQMFGTSHRAGSEIKQCSLTWNGCGRAEIHR